MLNNASKYALGVAVLGVLAAIAASDRAAAVVLVGVAIVAAVIAYGEGRSVGPDLAPFAAPDAPVTTTPVDPADVPSGSIGPMVVGLGAAAAFAGGGLGPRWVLVGSLFALVGVGIWTFDTYRTPGVLDARDATNVDHRLVSPIALPVGAFALAILIAFCFSRVLLAVSETASWVIAFIVAAIVLTILTLIAQRVPTSRAVAILGAVGLVGTLIAGGAGASAGERDFESHATVFPTATILAKGIAFDRKVMGLPADSDAEIIFTNLDVGTFHNVAVYSADERSLPLFNGRPIAKGNEIYKLHTPDPGTYTYVCDFHPAMVGELRVTEATESSEEGHE
ncbi:MAG: hypothetical protein H0U92_14495 [Actinobacteria bacterium]|nr:hypothetical protein [Actinomycetota bacterium]